MALNTDLVRNAAPNFATTLANSMLISDTSLTLQSGTGLPTATAITLVIDATDPVSGLPTPALKEVVTGTLSGTTLSNLLRGLDSTTQQGHASGANVVMWITADLWNDFQTSYLTQHAQLGTHTAITTTSITNSGNYAQTGGTFTVPNNTVTAAALATSAITLGSAQITSSPSNIGTSLGAISGLSVTVTIPAGGRDIEVLFYAAQTLSGAGLNLTYSLWDGTVGSGTQIGANITTFGSSSYSYPCYLSAIVTPSAGSKTYNIGGQTSTNAATLTASATQPAYILVRAI